MKITLLDSPKSARQCVECERYDHEHRESLPGGAVVGPRVCWFDVAIGKSESFHYEICSDCADSLFVVCIVQEKLEEIRKLRPPSVSEAPPS